jgi:prepilin-type N-terminal cleavage/methylation domain-containing protein
MWRGFTLVEILIVVAITALVGSIVLANTNMFATQTHLKAVANQILNQAKEVRQYSVSVEEFRNGTFPSYGFAFDITQPDRMFVYVDCTPDDNGNGIVGVGDTFHYTPGSTNCDAGGDLVDQVLFDPRIKIAAMRAVFPVDDDSNPSTPYVMKTESEKDIHILYLRPEPTLWMTTCAIPPATNCKLLPAGHFEVDLSDTDGRLISTLFFYSTGQFHIE